MASKKTAGPPKPSLSQIADEHRHLRETLERVEQATDLTALIPLLEDLRNQLEQHFAEEEAPGGLADAVGESRPRYQRHLDKLFKEHKSMLAATASIMERAQRVIDGLKAEILRDVRQLGHDLRAHEQTETELLMESVYSDIGSGD